MSPQSRTPSAFEHRLDRLFGRSADVSALIQRTGQKGLTVVTGRPRMGKTWMIQEVCRRLDEELDTLIGYFECPGGAVDMPLRAVADAYARWLRSSSFADQGKSLLKRHRDNSISRAGVLVGELIETATGGKALGGLGIADLFRKLAVADDDLKTGGLSLAPLPYDQVKELVDLLAELTGQSVVLVLDQWEKSDGWEGEVDLVDSYLRHAADWPHGHIIGVVRTEPASQPVVGRFERVCREWPAAQTYQLEAMERDEEEDARLLDHLRAFLPASALEEVSDEQLLGWVGGNPGVLHQWREPASQYRIGTAEGLEQVAQEAQANRFPDLEAALERLRSGGMSTRPLLNLAIRLALIPSFEEPAIWGEIRPIILDDSMDDATVAELQDLGILSVHNLIVPTYGHEVRREIVTAWALGPAKALTRFQAMELMREAAARVKSTNFHVFGPSVIVIEIFRRTRGLSLPRTYRLPFYCCRSLLGGQASAAAVLALAEGITSEDRQLWPPVLLAMGLVNTLTAASVGGDWERRDILIGELRKLSSDCPDDRLVLRILATGLYNVLRDASSRGDASRRDELIAEMRGLLREHSWSEAVREQLAMGLFSTLTDELDRRNWQYCNAVLNELRMLTISYTGDAVIRRQLAMGLFNTLHYVSVDRDLSRRNQLLEELRALSLAHQRDAMVAAMYGKSLVKTLNMTKDSERCRELLTEVQRIQELHSSSGIIRTVLAIATALVWKKLSHDTTLTDPLVAKSLRTLDWSREQLERFAARRFPA